MGKKYEIKHSERWFIEDKRSILDVASIWYFHIRELPLMMITQLLS